MDEKIISNLKWYLITIDDPYFLRNESMFNIINITSSVIGLRFVILDYVFGAAQNGLINLLQKDRGFVWETDQILKTIRNIQSLEWGDFFLFKDYPKYFDNNQNELYPYIIGQTDTTIRAIDGQYIYIYTPYQEIVDIVKAKYNIEDIKFDLLENLSYPC